MCTHTHRVRYHEVDQQGYLFNGRYLEIADVAFAEYFRGFGWSYSALNEIGFDPSVVKVAAEFRAPARYDDELTISVRCTRIGTSSFDLKTLITCGGVFIAELDIIHVNVHAASATSMAIPQQITAVLLADHEGQKEA